MHSVIRSKTVVTCYWKKQDMPRFATMCNVLFKCHRTLPWQINNTFIKM
nr:MAG TPA: hypothetical protein [Caudoviricetes sp.]